MKSFKKIQIAAAVMAATAGIAVSTAQADSLLAPLVVADTNYATYFSFKVPGATAGSMDDTVHYTWIKKGTTLASLGDLPAPCTITNNAGKASKNDMIFQDSRGNTATPAGPHNDGSTPNGYNATSFVGMAVITDKTNMPANNGNSVPSEGGMSGFAYIVDTATGDIQDYKLLNNHRSLLDGDFSAGFTANKSVDLSWMGSNQLSYLGGTPTPAATIAAFPGIGAQTGWTAMVTGPDMAQDGGLFSSIYDASVVLSQNTRTANGVLDAGQDSPQDAMGPYGTKGVMDNDEGFTSGNVSVAVTCMGVFTRSNMMDAQLLADTRYGGWTRLSISTQDGATGVSPHRASGAMVYRADRFDVMGAQGVLKTELTMQPETAGHLRKGHNHPNRPF